jgi:hypothetical protein
MRELLTKINTTIRETPLHKLEDFKFRYKQADEFIFKLLQAIIEISLYTN